MSGQRFTPEIKGEAVCRNPRRRHSHISSVNPEVFERTSSLGPYVSAKRVSPVMLSN